MVSRQGVAISVRALGRGESLQNKYQSRSDHMVTYSFPFLYVVSPPTEPKGGKGDLPPGIKKTLLVLLLKTLIYKQDYSILFVDNSHIEQTLM